MLKPPKCNVPYCRPLVPPRDSLQEKLDEVLSSGQFTNNGSQKSELEALLSTFLGVEHLSLVSNGTLALQLAVQVLGLKDEVITTPFTFAATAHSLLWNGVTPVFCDVDPVTLNLDASQIEALISEKTTGILPVHCFGIPCDVDTIQSIADQFGLSVLYDAAHCFGVELRGSPIGTFGDASVFSTHATKIFHTLEGGIVCCATREIKEKIDRASNFGFLQDGDISSLGTNAKLNEVQAGFGLCTLPMVSEEIARREKVVAVYREQLDLPEILLPPVPEDVSLNYYNFTIRVRAEYRDPLLQYLLNEGITARRYFYPLVNEMNLYKGRFVAATPVAKRVAQEVLSLPLYGLMWKEVECVCRAVRDFFGG